MEDKVRQVVQGYVLMFVIALDGVAFQGFINSYTPGQNGRNFADDIFIWIFVHENFCISIKISLKFVTKGPKFTITQHWFR